LDFLLSNGLLAVLAALLLAAFAVPIPEDISLLAAGVLARQGHHTLATAYRVCYVGVIVADTIVHTLGRTLGLHPKGTLGRWFGPHKARRIIRFYKRFGRWAVVICRNFPGMRYTGFFLAGASHMPLQRFLVLDGLASIFTVGLYVTLGYVFGDEISGIVLWLKDFREIAVVVGGCVLALAAWWLHRPVGPDDASSEDDLPSLDAPKRITPGPDAL